MYTIYKKVLRFFKNARLLIELLNKSNITIRPELYSNTSTTIYKEILYIKKLNNINI